MAKKCPRCGAELIDLFTSVNVCPNDCSADDEVRIRRYEYTDANISGIHCVRDHMGASLTNGHWTDVFINASEIKEIYDTLCEIVKRGVADTYFIYTPQPIVFEYSPQGNSLATQKLVKIDILKITHGRLTDAKRAVFNIFLGDDVAKLIKFLTP